MVNTRFIAVISSASLIFLIGLFLGQVMSEYSYSEIKSSQEEMISEIMGYELASQIITEAGECNFSFDNILKERTELGRQVSDLEERVGAKDPRILAQKERYHLYQIKEYLFLKEFSKECNLSMPLIIYFYSQDDEESIAQGYILDTLAERYEIKTIYAIDYEIKNPAIDILKYRYNVKSAPSIVIDEVTYSRIVGLVELENILGYNE